MRNLNRASRGPVWRIALGCCLALLAACSADEPSTPTQPPGGNVPPPAPSGFTVTVGVSPGTLSASASAPATVTVTVQANSGASLPAGSQAVLTTTLGAFGSTGGGNTTTIDLVNGQGQAFLFANGSTGIAQVRATFTSGTDTSAGSTTLSFSAPETFFLSAVTPNFGSAQGGDTVTILGGGFHGPIRVLFGGTPAVVLDSNSSQIRVRTPQTTVPAGQTLAVSVTVTIRLNETGQATDTLDRAFTYGNGPGTAQPVVLSVSPTAGTNDGGTTITIVGDGFEQPVQVLLGTGATGSFSGVEATIQSVARTRIIAVTPAARGFGLDNRDQLVNLLVRNVNSGATAVMTSAFQYGARIQITSMGPTEGPRQGGTRVTIFGQGFDDPVAVEFGGFGQTPVSTTGSEIVAVAGAVPVPLASACTDPSGAVRVTNIETGATATGPIYTYRLVRPSITTLNPTNGPGGGGNTVSVLGFGFESPLRVLFDGRAASVVGTPTATQANVLVPPYTKAFTQVACTTGGGAPGQQFSAASVDVELTNLDTGCVSKFPLGYTYNPPDTLCRATGSAPVASFTFTKSAPNVIFADTSSNSPTSWSWNFGDPTSPSNTSSAQNPTHTYVGAGPTFTVTLTVSNAVGSSTTSQFVTLP